MAFKPGKSKPQSGERGKPQERSGGSFRPARGAGKERFDPSDKPARKKFSGGDDRPERPAGRKFSSEGADRPAKKFFSKAGDRPAPRKFSDGADRPDRKPFSKGPARPGRPGFSSGSDRPERSERKPYSRDTDRPARKPYSDSGDRPAWRKSSEASDRPERSERKPYAGGTDRPARKPFAAGPGRPKFGVRKFSGGADRPAYGKPSPYPRRDREAGEGAAPDRERKPYSSDRKPYSRDTERKPFSRDTERKPFSRDTERKPFSRDKKPFSRPGSTEGGADRPKYGKPSPYPRRDRDAGEGAAPDRERKPFARSAERKPFSRDTERKPFSRDKKPFSRPGSSEGAGDRPKYGKPSPYPKRDREAGESASPDRERKPFSRGGERKPFSSDRKPFSRPSSSEGAGDRPRYGKPSPYPRRDRDSDEGAAPDRERKPFSRDSRERKPFSRDTGERKPFSRDSGERKPFSRDGESREGGTRTPLRRTGERVFRSPAREGRFGPPTRPSGAAATDRPPVRRSGPDEKPKHGPQPLELDRSYTAAQLGMIRISYASLKRPGLSTSLQKLQALLKISGGEAVARAFSRADVSDRDFWTIWEDSVNGTFYFTSEGTQGVEIPFELPAGWFRAEGRILKWRVEDDNGKTLYVLRHRSESPETTELTRNAAPDETAPDEEESDQDS